MKENRINLTPEESRSVLSELYKEFLEKNAELIQSAAATQLNFDDMRRTAWVDEIIRTFGGERAGDSTGNIVAIPDTLCGVANKYIYIRVETLGSNSDGNMNDNGCGTDEYRAHYKHEPVFDCRGSMHSLIRKRKI